ncbi:MAG: futalosine hydrolase [Planctomycetota bacterium]|nr:futalosine hydrolase [Planctomycetota bacterium]
MTVAADSVTGDRVLIVVAHPREVAAVCRGLGGRPGELWKIVAAGAHADVAWCGVGKANAAGCVGRVFDGARHGAVLSVGVAGSLPSPGAPGLRGVILATASVFADEGLVHPGGFDDLARMGLAPEGVTFPVSEELGRRMGALADIRAPIACVSACSGTDGAAAEVARRTGALAEAMEGAACALAAARLGARFAEVRVISNTTGDRARQAWDLEGALGRLEAVIGPAVGALR